MLSTGPRTEEGKAISSRNAIAHGLASSAVTMLHGEDPQQYLDLANGLIDEHKPATLTEDALVGKMAEHLWFSRRARNLQSLLIVEGPADMERKMNLYLRYQTTHDRAFSKALADLLKLRKEKRKEEQEFVSQKQKQETHEAKTRLQNARAEDLETRTEVRQTLEAPLPTHLRVPFDTLKSAFSQVIAEITRQNLQATAESAA